jgi:hypothetical protein
MHAEDLGEGHVFANLVTHRAFFLSIPSPATPLVLSRSKGIILFVFDFHHFVLFNAGGNFDPYRVIKLMSD